ncbi:PREDICTED: sodium-dependent proline transporter-like isoform X1 [Branchiostoma belcheri]|uniref:Transporter n=2 Tax=Branchiostoma belcheri TaxID=7741 RepID=A0A6P4YLJ0_BRABE|nr:PREDICTED: sodium-dependent proline transporter-like isoform X1 [Branchiostoma belcheri]
MALSYEVRREDIPERNEVSQPSGGGDENADRGNWTGKLDFILSGLGFAIGLGNVWRFPYLCYRNGGGAFLIPYVIMLACAGLPLFFMELSFGQFASLGPITIWNVSPIFKGVGYAMVVVSALVCIYYNVIIAWALYYLFASFTNVLPWTLCNQWWNTDQCGKTFGVNGTNVTLGVNGTNSTDFTRVSASHEFWTHKVLQLSKGIDQMGTVRWDLALCLLLAWVIVGACLIKGVKSSGKVVYFTATFPFVVLFILFFRGVTLEGAERGIRFYIIPEWSRLAESKVWGDAAIQIFYSLGLAFGSLATLSSYNKFHNNVMRDALIIAVGNCCTSIFSGFVIFSIIGHMSFMLDVPVDKVADEGPGLAFVAYPEAISLLPISTLWAILFFLMLLTLGLDSQFAMMETVITAVIDEYPEYLRPKKSIVVLGLCVIGYLLALPQTTNAGMYWLQLLDWYSAGFSLMIISLCLTIAIQYVYGMKRFSKDIKTMLGFEPPIYFKVCWVAITPALLMFILIFNLVQFNPVTYGDYEYPNWAEIMGLLMGLSSCLLIPVVAVIQVCRQKGSLLERIKAAARPSPDWGPALEDHRQEMMKVYAGKYGVEVPLDVTPNKAADLPPDYTTATTLPRNDISVPFSVTGHTHMNGSLPVTTKL